MQNQIFYLCCPIDPVTREKSVDIVTFIYSPILSHEGETQKVENCSVLDNTAFYIPVFLEIPL